MLLAFVGLILFTYPLSLHAIDRGLLFGLATGALGVGANAVGKQAAGKAHDLLLILARATGPLLLALVLILANNEPFVPHFSPLSALLSLVFAIGILIASHTVLLGYKNFDLHLGSIVASSELLFAAGFAVIFFKEIPSGTELAGAVVIFLAIIVANLPNGKARKKS